MQQTEQTTLTILIYGYKTFFFPLPVHLKPVSHRCPWGSASSACPESGPRRAGCKRSAWQSQCQQSGPEQGPSWTGTGPVEAEGWCPTDRHTLQFEIRKKKHLLCYSSTNQPAPKHTPCVCYPHQGYMTPMVICSLIRTEQSAMNSHYGFINTFHQSSWKFLLCWCQTVNQGQNSTVSAYLGCTGCL